LSLFNSFYFVALFNWELAPVKDKVPINLSLQEIFFISNIFIFYTHDFFIINFSDLRLKLRFEFPSLSRTIF